jgi:hypothetical protein
MGTTTFTGPVRSEGGFQVVSKNSTTVLIQTLQLLRPQVLSPTNM